MTDNEILSALSQIFRDVFLRDDIQMTLSLSANDVEDWDSMKQIEIIVATEEFFRIKFSTREIDRLRNVGDLVSGISKKLPPQF